MARIPLCLLCYKDLRLEGGGFEGGWVEFSDYAPLPPLPDGDVWVDDPRGIEWFCKNHLPAAQTLTHLPWKEALAELQRQFGVFSRPVYTLPKLTWWQWLCSWF